MNKLVNLIIIFLSLRFFIPAFLVNISVLAKYPQYFNLFTGLFVMVIQFIYNLLMKFTKRKDMKLKDNLFNSFMKGLIVVTCYQVFEDIKSGNNIVTAFDEKTIKSGFVIFVLLIFILSKCLISP